MSRNQGSPSNLNWAKQETALVLGWLARHAFPERTYAPTTTKAAETRNACFDEVRIRGLNLRREGFEYLLSDDADTLQWSPKTVVPLPPPIFDSSLVGILRLSQERKTGQHREWSVQVAFFYSEDDNLRMFGYRYESPSPPSATGVGEHNFFHVQPIREVRGCPLSGCSPDHKSAEGPTFPLPATNVWCSEKEAPVALILFMVRSVYPQDQFNELVSELEKMGNIGPEVRELISKIKSHFSH